MPMVPLSFVLAAVLVMVLWGELTESELAHRNRFMAAFVAILTLHLVLIGIRYGYDVKAILRIQPFTGAALAPLAYLAFRNPSSKSERRHLWIHLLPLATTVIAISIAVGLLDIALGLFSFAYAVALALLGMKGQDALPWARLNRIVGAERALWVVVILLMVSGITDIAVAVDFALTRGQNTARIAGLATVVGILLAVASFMWVRSENRKPTLAADGGTSGDDASRSPDNDETATVIQSEIVDKVEQLMIVGNLHHDPDLNLNRLARKLGIPARQVSEAINRTSGMSLSQYVNQQRIADACRLLETTDDSITNVMMACGYNTKSNFNREFKRVTEISPSAWRKNRLKT